MYYERDAALELGSILEEQGAEEEALGIYLKALADLCEVNERIAAFQGGEENAADSGTLALFERAISLLIKSGQYAAALKYFEMSASYSLLKSLDLSAICPRDEKLRELIGKMEELSKKADMIRRDMEKNDDEKRKSLLTGVLASTRQEFFAVLN